MQKPLIYLIIMAFMPFAANAQSAKSALQFNWSVDSKQRTFISKPVLTQNQYKPAFQIQQIRYALPKAAIFCRMEDAVYKRFNFLFKIRMGTEDYYSN